MRTERQAVGVTAFGSLLLLAVLVGTTGKAAAAEGGQPRADVLEEILVTARKRVEPLQSVPMSITAITQEQLEQRGDKDFEDLALAVPGVSFGGSDQAGHGQSRIVVRGISSASRGAETVGFYLDETPVSAGVSDFIGFADPKLFDIARVEILRGPQGTLYGASSMGGTIKLISNRPNLKQFEARTSLELSDTRDTHSPGYEGQFVLSGPIIEGRLALRGGAYYRTEAGFISRIDLTTGNVVEHDANEERTSGGRFSALYKPVENLEIIPAVYLEKTEVAHSGFFFNSLPRFATGYRLPEHGTDRMNQYTLTAVATFDKFNVTSATSAYRRDFARQEDYTLFIGELFGVPDPNGFFGFGPAFAPLNAPNLTDSNLKLYTQEVRIASGRADSKLQWLLGGFFSKEILKTSQDVLYTGLSATILREFGVTASQFFNDKIGYPFGIPANDAVFFGHGRNDEKQKAAFGELSYNVTDKLRVTAGVRHFKNDRIIDGHNDGLFNGGPGGSRLTSDESGTTPKFQLSYNVTPAAMVYATAVEGFRTGGPNGPVPTGPCGADLAALGLTESPRQFGSDSLWNYELGSKTAWLNGGLVVNGALYYIDWRDIQQTVFLNCGFSFTDNVGKATSKGGELEFSGRLTEALSLAGSFGYTDATLGKDVPQVGAHAGQHVQNVPKTTYSAALVYEVPFFGAHKGELRLDHMWQGESFRNFSVTSPSFRRPSYDVTNLRFTVPMAHWQVAAYVRNVLDRQPILENRRENAVFRGFSTLRPRTFGLNAAYTF